MEKRDLNLLNRIYQNAQIGMLSVDKVIKKTKDDSMKKLLKKQFDLYSKCADKCMGIAMSDNLEISGNNFFIKFRQTTMIYLSLWTNNTLRHIVEMMIQGTLMGIIVTIKAKKDYPTDREDINNLVVEFMKLQEDFFEKLKKLLAKV